MLKLLFSLATFNVHSLNYFLVLCAVVLFELTVSLAITKVVAYTEIDWIAYMQEVRGFLQGDMDYKNLRGDTGPLVYPAGFVYIYSCLHELCNKGTNILCGQYVFVVLHALFIGTFFSILWVASKRSNAKSYLPLWTLAMTMISRRIHSIFVLRLFNDCFAVFFNYVSILFLVHILSDEHKSRSHLWWSCVSILHSVAVSVKMNILLYSPAIGLYLVEYLGVYGAFIQVVLCVLVQILLGFPFLISFPQSYIFRAFNLSKDFEYKWTVNFKFINEQMFLDKRFGHALLLLLLLTLFVCANWIWSRYKCGMEHGLKGFLEYHFYPMDEVALKIQQKKRQEKNLSQMLTEEGVKHTLKKENHYENKGLYALDCLFLCNFIGIVFAKSLHYQFYVWYFHTLPYLCWRSDLWLIFKWLWIFIIEIVWNIFPSNAYTSLTLWGLHICLLLAVVSFQNWIITKKNGNNVGSGCPLCGVLLVSKKEQLSFHNFRKVLFLNFISILHLLQLNFLTELCFMSLKRYFSKSEQTFFFFCHSRVLSLSKLSGLRKFETKQKNKNKKKNKKKKGQMKKENVFQTQPNQKEGNTHKSKQIAHPKVTRNNVKKKKNSMIIFEMNTQKKANNANMEKNKSTHRIFGWYLDKCDIKKGEKKVGFLLVVAQEKVCMCKKLFFF
ncbi:hypothetical protein RFI_31701 [Reticulomyxa filosa]|uniref:dolichyl-P-Man:Man5GlcNAc2-PP-dolichol alpha-1,3-mannosyltransferase n=1 Tax=Reticulomyxa filosa TaxID=46433 RepID=X6LVN7_RETFI|nr:hypothetical protein RFI_31701 [Reticulomyxa filosa]|eukprot:ETO05694.1 hypothetical protein RFI_31701 [Reticulomyxa filosa]